MKVDVDATSSSFDFDFFEVDVLVFERSREQTGKKIDQPRIELLS